MLDSARLQRLRSVGVELREFLNSKQGVALFHPVSKHRLPVSLVEFYEPDPDSNDGAQSGRGWDQRSVVVFGQGQVDRSPCGTGTCATMAMLHHKGRLQLGHTHRVCGVVGTVFEGTLVEQHATPDGDMVLVVPEIKGRAFVTGINHLLLSSGDPFPEGFQLALARDNRELQ